MQDAETPREERFERRLIEETSKLRLEMAEQGAGLREAVDAGFTEIRKELYDGLTGLRQEMHAGFSLMQQHAFDHRAELLKWAFVFWAGQLAGVGGLLSLMLRRAS